MNPCIGERASRGELSRRDLLWLIGVVSAPVALPVLSGCAAHPVTGERVLVGLSEQEEINIDRRQSPHQFSSDYGAVQDEPLNRYLADLNGRIAGRSHRPNLPYSCRALNANYVNAYTFPAGSIGITRGILLEMDNEAQLAGLLGHELGHVNARHSAQSVGQAMVASAVLTGIGIAASASDRTSDWAPVIAIGGQLGASVLLASYSRDNEREADSLGMAYMTGAGYPASGMSELMGVLVRESREKPGLLETMFSSHPMSEERLATMNREAMGRYLASANAPVYRERYMDQTARLRQLRPAITEQQAGERAMASKRLPEAQQAFASALTRAPDDYTGLCLMAKCQIAQNRRSEAQAYLAQARRVYPTEGQAMQLSGINLLGQKRFAESQQELARYAQALPGDPNTDFLLALSHEGMQNRVAAAQYYRRYLGSVQQGDAARHAASRLKSWGVVR
jgi:predicted Zn-dependent protease